MYRIHPGSAAAQ